MNKSESSQSLLEPRLTELHIVCARDKALRIHAFSDAVYPTEWGAPYTEPIIVDLFEFAFHARRINEMCSIELQALPTIDVFSLKPSEGWPVNWEKSYKNALDRLIHARKFVFGNANADHRQLFSKSSANLIPMYVKVTTDWREEAPISLVGLTQCFLSSVLAQVQKKFPTLKF